MIVHEPVLTEFAGEVQIASHIETQTSLPNLPKTLWYRFPQKYASWLAPRADAFAPTALLVAMLLGEDLQVRGPLSPRLAYNLFEYRNIFHAWVPEQFHMIDIQYQHLDPPTPVPNPKYVATAFSGGVDSFYTLWAHMPEQQPIPASQVTHGLFVHGLDLRLDDETNYRETAEHYQELYAKLGRELILVTTNAYQFSEFRINWTFFFGPPLIGAAQLLSPNLHRFYMPSGMPSYLQLVPQGSSPLIDHLLSTETLEVIHHAASISRLDKLSALVSWPATYNNLRVCSDKKRLKGMQNCSACHKCYRTMTILELLGAQEHYSVNFPSKLSARSYLRWGILKPVNPDHARAIRNAAWKSRHISMALLIQTTILLNAVRNFFLGLIKKLLTQDQLYRIKYRIYQTETTNSGNQNDHSST